MKSSYSSSDERGKHNNKRVNCANRSRVFSLFGFHPLLKFNVSWLNNRNLEFMCRQTWTQQLDNKLFPWSVCVLLTTQRNFQGIFLSRLCARQKGRLNTLYLFGQEQETFFVSELQLNFCTLQASGLLCSRHESKSLAAASNICEME